MGNFVDLGVSHETIKNIHHCKIFSFEEWKSPYIEKVPVKKQNLFYSMIAAIKCIILCSKTPKSVILCNGGGALADKLTCLINSTLLRGRLNIVYFDPFTTSSNRARKKVSKIMLQGVNKIVVWSNKYIDNLSLHLGLPANQFVSIPYKSNHSKFKPISIKQEGYLFSGGNSARDYDTLFKAVKGLDVQVLVSTTMPSVLSCSSVPDNVILLSAREPYFSRLMAGSLFNILPLESGMIRGAGEQTICNAMFHGKTTIALDNISASDYIEDNLDGFVLAPGDDIGLREKIEFLLRNDDVLKHMSELGPAKVKNTYLHRHFHNRIVNICHYVSDNP